jgi:hypothetical protein
MVPRLSTSSASLMPMPLSAIEIWRFALSMLIRIASRPSSEQLGPRDRLVAQLVAGIGGVRDELPEKDLLVRIDGVHHQVQETRHLGLEGVTVLRCNGIGWHLA